MPRLGQAIPVALQLWDGSDEKFVTARVRDAEGVELPGSPFALSHVEAGFYSLEAPPTMPATAFVSVFFQVWNDEGHLIPSSAHETAEATFELTPEATAGGALLPPDITATISDEALRLEAVVREAEEIAAIATLDPAQVAGEVTGELVLVAKIEGVETQLEGGA